MSTRKNQSHTPGPWAAQTVFCHDRSAYVRELIDVNGDLVAELKFETTERPKPNVNESLITAAPELLETLERLRDEFDYPPAAYELILTAIRKAKGE